MGVAHTGLPVARTLAAPLGSTLPLLRALARGSAALASSLRPALALALAVGPPLPLSVTFTFAFALAVTRLFANAAM